MNKNNILLLILLLPLSLQALELKIMSFNTMCDFCKGSDFFNYTKRLKSIQKLINKESPDLIALQEMRTTSQVKELINNMPGYKYLATENFLISYGDPVIIYNSLNIKLQSYHQKWLGPPNTGFTLGWKFSIPRQLLWSKFIKDGREFIFATTHFDNRIENLTGSAKQVNHIFKKISLPIILAGDTNLTSDMPQYKSLISKVFINAFESKESFSIVGPYKTDHDICYLRKGKIFPACRVDHVLLSSTHHWKVREFKIDSSKFENKFPSDHRPVIVTLSLSDEK